MLRLLGALLRWLSPVDARQVAVKEQGCLAIQSLCFPTCLHRMARVAAAEDARQEERQAFFSMACSVRCSRVMGELS